MNDQSSTIQIRLTPTKLALVVIGIIVLVWLVSQIVPIKLPSLIPLGIDTKWSKPVQIGNMDFLYCWNGTAVGMGQGVTFNFLNDDGHWTEKTFPGFETDKNESCYPVIVDPHGPIAIFCDRKFTENKAGTITSLIKATMTQQGDVKIQTRIPIQDYVQDLFKAPRSDRGLTREISLSCSGGTMQGLSVLRPIFGQRRGNYYDQHTWWSKTSCEHCQTG